MKANAALLRGDDSGVESGLPRPQLPEARPLNTHVPRHAPANRTAAGVASRDDAEIQRNLMDAAGVPQSNEHWDVVPGSAGFSFRNKKLSKRYLAGLPRAAVSEAIDPRGRTEILEAGDIDFTGTRTARNGSGVRSIRDSRAEHGVSAEDALAILRGNKPPKPDFTVRGTGIPALPSDIAQRRSDFAEESAAAIGGGSREDRAKRLTEIRRPAVEAQNKLDAQALADKKQADKIAVEEAGPKATAAGRLAERKLFNKGVKEDTQARFDNRMKELEAQGKIIGTDEQKILRAQSKADAAAAAKTKADTENDAEASRQATRLFVEASVEKFSKLVQFGEDITPEEAARDLAAALATINPKAQADDSPLPSLTEDPDQQDAPQEFNLDVPDALGTTQGELIAEQARKLVPAGDRVGDENNDGTIDIVDRNVKAAQIMLTRVKERFPESNKDDLLRTLEPSDARKYKWALDQIKNIKPDPSGGSVPISLGF